MVFIFKFWPISSNCTAKTSFCFLRGGKPEASWMMPAGSPAEAVKPCRSLSKAGEIFSGAIR
jgi:hypothetical protein